MVVGRLSSFFVLPPARGIEKDDGGCKYAVRGVNVPSVNRVIEVQLERHSSDLTQCPSVLVKQSLLRLGSASDSTSHAAQSASSFDEDPLGREGCSIGQLTRHRLIFQGLLNAPQLQRVTHCDSLFAAST